MPTGELLQYGALGICLAVFVILHVRAQRDAARQARSAAAAAVERENRMHQAMVEERQAAMARERRMAEEYAAREAARSLECSEREKALAARLGAVENRQFTVLAELSAQAAATGHTLSETLATFSRGLARWAEQVGVSSGKHQTQGGSGAGSGRHPVPQEHQA